MAMATRFTGQKTVRSADHCGLRTADGGLLALLLLTVAAAGCNSPPTSLIESPLSVEQQQQAVLQVVPVGSTRDDAERKLKGAGIDYTAGQGRTIYYLSLWNRPDGQRWHINVALLFDSEGKLYASRPADAAVERGTGITPAAGQSGWRRAGQMAN